MNIRKHFVSPLAAVVLLAGGLSTGCSDSSLQGGLSSDAPEMTIYPKMRNSHLLRAKFLTRNKKPSPSTDATKDLDATASKTFVLSVSSLALDPMKVLERYEAMVGVTVKKSFQKLFKGFAIDVDDLELEALLALIEADPEIDWYEPDPEVRQPKDGTKELMEEGQSRASSLSHVQAQNTWALPGDGQGSVDIDVYVLDTGVNHDDLNVVERVDFSSWGTELDITKVLERYRVLERYDDTFDASFDEVGHGTHVAGIIGAIDDADGMVGVAPGARIHDFKIFDKSGKADMSSAIQAIDVIKARKLLDPAKPIVVNMSLGADVGTTEFTALDNAVADLIDIGVTVVVAAGNGGMDVATVTPAHVPGAITVAAAESGRRDRDGWLITWFSNFGAGVDIFAPGVDVTSLSPDPLYKVHMSGTSMSAPLVTGGAALYLAKNPTATPQEVRDVLVSMGNPDVYNKPANTTDLRLWLEAFCTDECTLDK